MAQSIAGTKACTNYARLWNNYKKEKSKSTLNRIWRLISRPSEVSIWNQRQNQALQQHDEEPNPVPARRHYFSPNHFYCVETLCAPCGVVLGWTLFDKAESPTNILNWLAEFYSTEESQPSFICIDKACQMSKVISLIYNLISFIQSRAKRMHVPIFSHHSISCEVFSTIYIWIFNVKIVSVISVYKV